MRFIEAYEALKQGAMIKLPEWAGFWKWEDNSIKMHCKDGRVLDIRETDNVDYTLNFIVRDEWEIVGEAEVTNLNIQTFTFGEAIRRLKAGQKVARKGWNGKGMYLYLVHGTTVDKENLRNEASLHLPNDEMAMHGTGVAEFLPHIDMRTANGDVCIGWLASQTDMLSEDWVIVE